MAVTIFYSIIFFSLLKSFIPFNISIDKEKYLDKKFNQVTWLTAHNSHLNWIDNSVIEFASNQNLSIDQQLASGVRGFMFDIDYSECSDFQTFFGTCKCQGVCLCHGKCSDNFKDGFSVKKLEYALKKIVKFLKNNQDQIITIFLENYLNDTQILQNVFKRVNSFNSLVFNPYSREWDVLNKGWPKIGEMVAADKRILIFDDEKRTQNAGKKPGFIRSRDFLLQNHYIWMNDYIEVNISDFENYRYLFNTSSPKMEISRCFSLDKLENRPNWGPNSTLNMNTREHNGQLFNSEKLFLFHHYYGVVAKRIFIDNITVKLMNSKELINKRLEKLCNPGLNGKKPNYIALDFITEDTYKNVIIPLNEN